MLTDIDGVAPDSLNNNKNREISSKVYLGHHDESTVCVIETYNEIHNKLSLSNFAITIDE
jgi:hypothetical protein